MPTDLQSKFIDYMANQRGSQAQFARDNDVDTETLRRWKKSTWYREGIDDFMREMNLAPEKVWNMMAAMQQAAEAGDVQAAKTVLAFMDRVQPMKQRVDDGDLAGFTTAELYALLDGPIE